MSQISQAEPADFPLILTFLQRCQLPQERLSVSFSHILVVQEADQVMMFQIKEREEQIVRPFGGKSVFPFTTRKKSRGMSDDDHH